MSQPRKNNNTPRRGKAKAGSSQPMPLPPENIFNVSPPVTNFQSHMQQMPLYSPGFHHMNPQLGFHQFQQGGFHQFQQGSYQQLLNQENYPVDEDEEADMEGADVEAAEVEVVPDTQPESMPKSKKDKKKFEKRAAPKMWTDEEEVALAKAWVTVSEDSVAGNSKKKDTFYVRITAHYNGLCSYKRTKDQVYSKWNDMKVKMKKFGGIFNQERGHYRSGFSDDDYIRRAHARYRNENNGKTFTNEAAWKVVKDHPAWLEHAEFKNDAALNPRPAKRSKSTSDHNTTSSDARCRFNLNEASNEDDYEVDIQEPQRPIGRDKAKRAASSSAKDSDNTMAGIRGYVEQIQLDNNKLLSVEENIAQKMSEKLEIMRQREERKRDEKKQKDLEFFISSHDHLQGAALNAVLQRKEELRQKYGW